MLCVSHKKKSSLQECSAEDCTLPVCCLAPLRHVKIQDGLQLSPPWKSSQEIKVHSWQVSTAPWAVCTWEDTLMSLAETAVFWWTASQRGHAWGGPCVSICRYADAWRAAATGGGDKTAHFILGISELQTAPRSLTASSPTETGSHCSRRGVGTMRAFYSRAGKQPILGT